MTTTTDINELPNYQLVTVALALLEGSQKKVYTEEIAELALTIAPDRFAWRLPKYSQRGWPDKFLVKCALEDAQKKKNGALVVGQSTSELSKDGWRLTPSGAEWIKKRPELLRLQGRAPSASLPKQDAQRFTKWLRVQPLFREFNKKGTLQSPSPYELTDMLNTSPDAAKDVIAIKFMRLRSTAELIGDPAIIGFLEACVQAFPHLLSTEEAT